MTAATHLDELARALAEAGWSSRPRYDRGILHVFDQRMPRVGESVRAVPDTAGRWWFYSSLDELLGSCQDLPAVVEAVGERVALCVELTGDVAPEWAIALRRPAVRRLRRLLGPLPPHTTGRW